MAPAALRPRPQRPLGRPSAHRAAALACCLLLWLLPGLLSPAWARTHRVEKGEWLGRILRRHVGGEVWGRGGSLPRTLLLNANIDDPNVIYPGQHIVLPAGSRQRQHRRPPRRQQAPLVAPAVAPPSASCSPCPSPPPCPPPPVCREGTGLSAVPASGPPAEAPGVGAGRPLAWAVQGGPTFAVSRLVGQDTLSGGEAALTSRLGPGAHLEASLLWRQMWTARLGGSLRSLAFAPPAGSPVSLARATAWLSEVYLGAGIAPLPRLRLGLDAVLGGQLFLAAQAVRHLELRTAAVAQARLSLTTTLWQAPTRRLQAEAIGGLLAGHQLADPGALVGLALAADTELSAGLALTGGLGWSLREQPSTLTRQSEQLVQLSMGLRWAR